MAEEYPCPHCGRGAFTVRDNSDAPIPVRVPDSVHDDEGRSVGHCPWCGEGLSAEGLRGPRIGDRVDTPFGLGVVRAIGPDPNLLGGPYVTVALEAKGMVIDDVALLELADVDVFQRAPC